MPATPYVVGQWVRAERFYGRTRLIAEILDGPRNCLWLLGTRRVGKTSVLKQLEHITLSEPERRYFPVFWDFQGADSSGELHMGFSDALLDAEEHLDELGIALSDIETDDLFTSLGRLRRALRPKSLRLLLLCDEVEELITLNQKDPSLLRKLRRAMQSPEDIRSVLASSIRLWALAEQKGDTSPFLHGFAPPLYIRNLADEAAGSLIRQANLPADQRPAIDDEAVEAIRRNCDNHPYLVQLVCKRYGESGELQEALEQVATDRMVSYFFSVDHEMLSEIERRIIRIIAERTSSTSDSIQADLPPDSGTLTGHLHRLENLGYIRRDERRRFVLINYFFRRWLDDMPDSQSPVGAPIGAGRTSRPADDQSTVSESLAPEVLEDRYELIEQVGRGANGVVYRAHDRMLNVTIAIKLLRRELAWHEEALERFRQEIILSREISHPNILRVYHLGEFQGQKYLIMNWIEGSTLAGQLADGRPLPVGTAVSIAIKLAASLEAAHARKILHRDIKPQNIMIDREGEPYLTDFGLARLMGKPGMTRDGIFLGTPYYASPEQARMLPLDERSDIYSLGMVLFEMTTGRRPFTGASAAEILELHRSSPAPDPRGINPELPRELADVVLRCLEKDPNRRFASAGELRRALEALRIGNRLT
jgi:hypothetical protein